MVSSHPVQYSNNYYSHGLQCPTTNIIAKLIACKLELLEGTDLLNILNLLDETNLLNLLGSNGGLLAQLLGGLTPGGHNEEYCCKLISGLPIQVPTCLCATLKDLLSSLAGLLDATLLDDLDLTETVNSIFGNCGNYYKGLPSGFICSSE
ncbi:hypothetical protein TorRG33x02_112520 [Trema orientale]|nr:hypothetical protein TorRG33x02_112520 [Trema orientale]